MVPLDRISLVSVNVQPEQPTVCAPGNETVVVLYVVDVSSVHTFLSDGAVGEHCGPVDLWSRKYVLQLFAFSAEHVRIQRK